MRFFGMDLHISVFADFKTACPDVEVVDWCLSGHAWVLKRTQDIPDHINPSTWKNLTPEMIKRFQDRYDPFLKTFDGFLVGYCSAFAMIYEKYGKPMIMMNAVRYDLPFCWTKDMRALAQWKECLSRLNSRGLLTIVSNNKADQLYTRLGCGIDSHFLPSLCLYTHTRYTPTKPTFLVYNGSFPQHPLLTFKQDLPQPHEWSDVTSFRGVINFPYEVSLMSCFEHFTAGCPMFFPSKVYWKSNPGIQSLSAYWGAALPIEFTSMSTPQAWIELADMYEIFQSPNTYYFDSTDHLFQILETFEYVDDHEFRQAHIERIKYEWKRVIQRIISDKFWTQSPRHMAYNRLPLLANVVYDANYVGTGVDVQHVYPQREPLSHGDVVFVKTDYLTWFLENRSISAPITLVTGVSDLSPTPEECRRVLDNPNITRWVGCNILQSDPKIVKLPIGVGEPERRNGNHDTLVRLHGERIPWSEKIDTLCIPYHGKTCGSRVLTPTLPKLDFEDYMRSLSKHKFVVCQRGNGVDTHRVCETLLMGSVPVIERSGLDDMYAQWPCLLVGSFDSVDTTSFAWDDAKYEAFLDVFWLRETLRERLL